MKKFLFKIQQYLCPPGNGVFTVHTAKEHKLSLQLKLYNESNPTNVLKAWKSSLSQLESSKLPCLLGITSDTGGGIQRGANWGPLFIRNQLLDYTEKYFDLGDTKTIPHLLHDKYLNAETIKSCQNALYGENPENLPVSSLSITENFCESFHKHFPEKSLFSLGGDHSISYSTVKPWLLAKKDIKTKTAIIHFDAHTDLMDKRLGIDICFGSWAYHMIELLDSPDLLMQFGIRSSGKEKSYWEKTLGVKQYWNTDFTNSGEDIILQETIQHLKSKGVTELYISFDIDALDSQFASATGTPEDNGLSLKQCTHLITGLSDHFEITGADLVEVAPFVRNTNSKVPEPDTTLNSAKIIAKTLIGVLK